jgi:hypothetical protein
VPVTSAVFPRLTQAATHEPERMPALYHAAAQVLSVAALPAAVVLIAFAPEVLLLWTGSPVTTKNTANIARLLVAGTAMSGLMAIPYVTQLAYGWTRLSIYVNTIAVLLLTPCVYVAARHYGGIGAAAVWVVLNLGYLVIGVQPMYRRYLHNERALVSGRHRPAAAGVRRGRARGARIVGAGHECDAASGRNPRHFDAHAAGRSAGCSGRAYVCAHHGAQFPRGTPVMTQVRPFFTVIVPTRERSETLRHTLATIVGQDYADLEILVSDNASEDETQDDVASFRDPRIRSIRTPRRLSMSRNWSSHCRTSSAAS